MKRALTIVSLGGFASTLFARAVDPIIPQIATDLAVDPQSAALLATAFAFPFALVPPIFGSFADIFGKARLIIVCQCVLVLAGIVSAIAPNIETLVAGRMLAGAAAGGIFPVSLALVGDLVPVKERQIGLSRYLAAMITGSLLGSTMAGLIGDALGWRAVFVVMTACAVGSLLSVAIGLRNISLPKSAPLDLRAVPASYRAILANPRAKICYVAVMIEGAVVFGLLPYVALLLAASGEKRALIAGIVLASFAIGGLVYSSIITRLLGWFGPFRLMFLGALSCALSLIVAAFDPSWPIKALAFAGFGFGFYSLHGYLQVQATELSATARGAALALHSTAFFLGQAIGPVLYGIGFNNIGATASILIAAGIILTVGLIVPRLLKSRGLSAAPD